MRQTGRPEVGDHMKNKAPCIASVIAAMAVCLFGVEKTFAPEPRQFDHDVDPEAAGTSAGKIAGMDALLQSFVDERKVSSVAAFVAKDGRVVYKQGARLEGFTSWNQHQRSTAREPPARSNVLRRHHRPERPD
jgi:hypothetical protein